MRIVERLLGALACVAIVSFFGCSSNNNSNCTPTTGTMTTGLLGGTAASCSNSSSQCSATGGTTCETCLAQSCCDQTLACQKDTTCIDCSNSCTDSQDCATCSGSDTTASGFFSCAFTKCSAQCGATATNACPAMAGDNACATCQKQSCCAELVACNDDTQCLSLSNQLTTQCGDMNLSCDAQVVQQSGDAAAASLLQCVQTSCSAQCGG